MSVTISPHATAARRLMNETAAVYTRAAGGGFTTAALTGLAVQMSHRAPPGVTVAAPTRAEQTSERWCYFDPAVMLPTEHCQFEVAGVRWNVTVGSVGEQRDRAGLLVYRHAHLVRVAA